VDESRRRGTELRPLGEVYSCSWSSISSGAIASAREIYARAKFLGHKIPPRGEPFSENQEEHSKSRVLMFQPLLPGSFALIDSSGRALKARKRQPETKGRAFNDDAQPLTDVKDRSRGKVE